MKKRKKLVPLIPILKRLGACDDALAMIAERKAPTFAKAWADMLACDDTRSGFCGFLDSNGMAAILPLPPNFRCICSCSPEDAERHLAARGVTRASVERALYNYAKREGLA